MGSSCVALALLLCVPVLTALASPRAPPIADTPAIDIHGEGWDFVGGDWLPASPSPYPYSGGKDGENIKGSWNAPAATIVPGATNAFGPHPVQDDTHLAIYTKAGPLMDFSASFDLTHTAQLASGYFILRAKDAAHYYMIEIPESGIATRDGFEGIYVSRVGDDTGGRWARGLFVDQLHGVPSQCCGVWKTIKITVVGSTLSIWVNDFPVGPLELTGANGEFALGGYVGFGTTSGWYAGACPLYIKNFRLSAITTAAAPPLPLHSPDPGSWNASIPSTLGTAWWFPTPMVNGRSIDYPPPGGAPGPGSSAHFAGGMIGYGGTPTKTLLANKTAEFWNGFILSRDLGETWFKGPTVPAPVVVPYPGHGGYEKDTRPSAQPPSSQAGAAAATKARVESGNPWSNLIPARSNPSVMWYDTTAQQTVGYWITPKPVDVKDGTGAAFRLIERRTTATAATGDDGVGLFWDEHAPIRRNITMLELVRTQCTGLSGGITDNTTALGRCHLGARSSNGISIPGFNASSLLSWRATFGANDNTFTVTPNGTLLLWLSFANDFDLMESNGRTYWTMPFGSDNKGGTSQNGVPQPGSDGPPWMMACLRSVDRGQSFELINTDATLGLGRDRDASENRGFSFMSDAAGRGAISAMGWTSEGEIFASGVANWAVTSAWSHDWGKTWQPITHGPFWMAANYGITTASGVLIFGGRYPDIGIQVSYDSGRSWQWYVIDTSAFEANGNFLEIRPDEVLFMYGGSYQPKGNRMQLIKVDRPRRAAWPIPIAAAEREAALAGRGPGGGPAPGGNSSTRSEAVQQKVVLTY